MRIFVCIVMYEKNQKNFACVYALRVYHHHDAFFYHIMIMITDCMFEKRRLNLRKRERLNVKRSSVSVHVILLFATFTIT